ncbi:hypothetical protein AB5J72_28485 [Streptomyces sp. CG1]|uniref:hypothetical protein n=1 Tax=Streptomyces sp. CG1 TaxID=1287523 RepID=UPI0034E2D0D4
MQSVKLLRVMLGRAVGHSVHAFWSQAVQDKHHKFTRFRSSVCRILTRTRLVCPQATQIALVRLSYPPPQRESTVNRPARLVTAALTASAALLLTACSSGGGGSSSDKIAGADTSGTQSASPSASASADGIDRPEIKLPSDMKDVFEDQQTGDAVKDTILADNARSVMSVDQALAYGDLKKSGMGFYYTDTALTGVYEYAKNANAKNLTWSGTVRYFDRKVTVFSKTTAAVTYCSDEGQANPKDRKTNKVQKVATSADSYVYYNTGVKKNKDGVWQTWNLTEDRGSKKCQP